MARDLRRHMPSTRLPAPLTPYKNPYGVNGRPTAFEYRLQDGTPLLIRWVNAGDGPLLQRGFQALSEKSRQRRFFTAMSDLSDKQTRYFTDIDHENHMAWGARDMSQPEQPGVGVARYIRSDTRPDKAEVAITVIDDYQNKGVGTVLLAALNLSASGQGIQRFIFDVRNDNEGFIRRLKAYGGKTVNQSQGMVRIEVPVFSSVGKGINDSSSARVLRSTMRNLSSVAPGAASAAGFFPALGAVSRHLPTGLRRAINAVAVRSFPAGLAGKSQA